MGILDRYKAARMDLPLGVDGYDDSVLDQGSHRGSLLQG